MEKLSLNETDVLNQYNRLKNIHKVAEYFNVSISPITRILKSQGFELTNRRYHVNHNYFDKIDSEDKAYWLGFLYADGYIRERKTGNSLEMKLSIKDKHHLELFRDTIGSNHKIIDGFNKVKYNGGIARSHISSLAIYSIKLVESIKSQGFHSRKTFTIEKPNINDDLIHHFIRGYFDGDGCFSFNPEKNKIHTNIVCASDKFRESLTQILNQHDIDAKFYGRMTIHIQSKIGNVNFYDYIYKNATIFLKRKREKYENFREFYKYNN